MTWLRKADDGGMPKLPPGGKEARTVGDAIYRGIQSSQEDKSKVLSLYHSVDVSTFTGNIPGGKQLMMSYAKALKIPLPKNIDDHFWDGVFIHVVRQIENSYSSGHNEVMQMSDPESPNWLRPQKDGTFLDSAFPELPADYKMGPASDDVSRYSPQPENGPSAPSEMTVQDVQVMDPKEKQRRLDLLLDSYNESESPEEKAQLEQRMRSLGWKK